MMRLIISRTCRFRTPRHLPRSMFANAKYGRMFSSQRIGSVEFVDDDLDFMDNLDIESDGAAITTEELDGDMVPLKSETYIHDDIRDYLQGKGIKSLFPVQAQAYKPLLDGQDVIVRSRTGTGKTLAFGMPLAQRVMEKKQRAVPHKPSILILEPTRELAEQVRNELSSLPANLRVVAVYGGAGYEPQINGIARGAHVVVACPGRLVDLMGRNALHVAAAQNCDEAVRLLLEMGVDPTTRCKKGERPLDCATSDTTRQLLQIKGEQ